MSQLHTSAFGDMISVSCATSSHAVNKVSLARKAPPQKELARGRGFEVIFIENNLIRLDNSRLVDRK